MKPRLPYLTTLRGGGLCASLCLFFFTALAQTSTPVRHAFISIEPADNGFAQGRVIAVPLERVEPFLALGAQWQATAATRLQIRTSTDGATWSEWLPLTQDHDSEANTSSLVILDAATRFIEYRADNPGALRFHFISPGATSDEMLRAVAERSRLNTSEPSSKSMSQSNVKYPKPPVVTRTEWGCPDGQTTSRPPLSYTTVTHLIVHHSATGNTVANNDWPAVVRSIWNLHMFTNGWSDVGYNYLVDPNGVVYEGRSGGDNVVGAHFSGVNGNTMGVCMLGTYTNVTPNEKALNSLRRILAWKADQRGIDPAGKSRHAASGLDLNNISGHRDGPGATECPGDAFYPLLTAVRAGVKQLLTGTTAPLASVSAASYAGEFVAIESIAAAFGNDLAATAQIASVNPLPVRLGETTVTIRDSANQERLAPLFFVSPDQINYQVPAGLAAGQATVIVSNTAGQLSSGIITLAPLAPALFAANANGRGIAAAVVLRIKADGTQSYEPAAQYDAGQNQFIALPIDVSAANEQVFLVAFGTGLRNRSSLANVAAQIGGESAEVLYVGTSGSFVGLDQINLRLPRTLAGRGDIDLTLTADGQTANSLLIRIK